MRGRLINPFLLYINQMNRALTAEDPDGAGNLGSGYDNDFREVVRVPDATHRGASARAETEIIVQCQVEPKEFEILNAMTAGDSPDSKMTFILAAELLERAGLIGVDGEPLVYIGDRITKLTTMRGKLVHTFRDPPGLYVRQVQPIGIALGRDRNLILVECWGRKTTGRGIGETAR